MYYIPVQFSSSSYHIFKYKNRKSKGSKKNRKQIIQKTMNVINISNGKGCHTQYSAKQLMEMKEFYNLCYPSEQMN